MIRHVFQDYESLGDHEPVISDYNRVYSGKLYDQELDDIYRILNTAHPDGFTGHSLSVSDVVVIHRDGTDKAYYVDSFGFKELPGFKQPQMPNRKEKEHKYEETRTKARSRKL